MADHGNHAGNDPTTDSADRWRTPTQVSHPNDDHSQMYFHFGTDEVILFEPWRTNSAGGIALACILIIIFAILYEALKMLRYHIQLPFRNAKSDSLKQTDKRWIEKIFTGLHIQQTLLYMIQSFMSLCIMMIFMTFNIYLCAAVVLGAGIGYLVFGCLINSDDNDRHC